MEMLKRLDPIWMFLVVVGGLNWGILGLFEENVLAEIFGTGTAIDVVYTVIGVAALVLVPRMLEGVMHMGGRAPRPHGA